MKKVLVVVGMLVSLGLAGMPVDGFAQVNGGDQATQTFAAIKEWLYKYESGNYYRRLWNYSTGKWEGPWIKC